MKKILIDPHRFILILSWLLGTLFSYSQAIEIHVSSIAALQAATNGASAGDIIVLDNGTYLNNNLSVGTSNITVKAATPGGVYLNGTNAISITGSYVTFSGFQFTSKTIITGSVITVSGNYNTLTQLNFNGYSADHMIYISGLNNVVSYSNFQNKLAVLVDKAGTGDMVQIIPNASAPGYNTIRYCSFQHMPGMGGDYGNECIRIGNSGYAAIISRTIVEYCYFEDTGLGDSEAISVKSRENILRYNTMKNNQDAMFTFRNGDNNIAYGNFFINAGGIRVKEANNIYCYNNYFEKSGIGGNTDAVTYVYYTVNTVNVLININFIHNTFVDCGDIVIDKGATNNTWANNIFKKSSGNIFTASSASGISWAGNMYQGTLGLSIPSGMISVDPKLMLKSDGYYGLSSSSPAIDAASVSYPPILDIPNIDDDPSITLDISGQTRPSTVTLKDVGCDEYNATGLVRNRPLTLSNVGPSYLGGPTGVKESAAKNPQGIPPGFKLYEAYPNPFNPSTNITFFVGTYGYTSLRVYDLLGREVTTLVDGMQSVGEHQVQWNAAQYPGGIYFCTLQRNTKIESRKIVLLK